MPANQLASKINIVIIAQKQEPLPILVMEKSYAYKNTETVNGLWKTLTGTDTMARKWKHKNTGNSQSNSPTGVILREDTTQRIEATQGTNMVPCRMEHCKRRQLD